MRTDDHNNPIAATTDLAKQAGLVLVIDYTIGDPFPGNANMHTARFLKDPIVTSIKLIDAVGYYTRDGKQRWDYIAVPRFVWSALTADQKRDIVGFHYQREGGTFMRHLFPNWGKA